MEGFVQLHKKICEWEWYTDIPTKVLFFHILLKCNYKEARWRGVYVKPGDFITSIDHLSKETGLSIRQIRTALSHLETTGEISKQSTSLYTILTLNNWDTYNIRDDKPTTNERQTSDKRATTTNKNNKEYKENKEYIETETMETFPSEIEQALEPIKKVDNRNIGTQRIIDIIKTEIESIGYLYEKNAQDRNRATIIAKRQSEWGNFIKDSSEEIEEDIIRKIIRFSNSNEFVKKIKNAYDFHEKWQSVANAMKKTVSEPQKSRVF